MVQCRLQPGSHAREEAAEQGARCPSELTASVPCQLVSFSGSTLLDESSEMDACVRACMHAGDTYVPPTCSASGRMEQLRLKVVNRSRELLVTLLPSCVTLAGN